MTGTLLDGAPRSYRYGLWEETRRALRAWPDDPAIAVCWVEMDGHEGPVTLQMDRAEAERIAALDMHDEMVPEIGAEMPRP
jgi:hypothetical protein